MRQSRLPRDLFAARVLVGACSLLELAPQDPIVLRSRAAGRPARGVLTIGPLETRDGAVVVGHYACWDGTEVQLWRLTATQAERLADADILGAWVRQELNALRAKPAPA